MTEEDIDYFEADNSTRRLDDTMVFEDQGLLNSSKKSNLQHLLHRNNENSKPEKEELKL